MPRRLPPLSTLPSFEAAARHLSFSKAADELHVTHGAVSRAVRHLEEHLRSPLFTRAVRAVQLTSHRPRLCGRGARGAGTSRLGHGGDRRLSRAASSMSARSIPSPPNG